MNTYKVLSKAYKQIADQRNHFGKQHHVLTFLFDLFGITKNAKILDAACGTGDVINLMHADGYNYIYAVDGSSYQLSQWEGDKNIPVKQVRWQDLASIFQDWGDFDCVFFLGHSLPHLSADELPRLFMNVFSGLKKDGILAFDIRPWSKLKNGQLVESGCEEGITRYLSDVELDGKIYRIFEETSYEGSVQEKRYCFTSKTPDKRKIFETLQYHMFDWKYTVELLIQAGFEREWIKVYRLTDWPYLVVTAKK